MVASEVSVSAVVVVTEAMVVVVGGVEGCVYQCDGLTEARKEREIGSEETDSVVNTTHRRRRFVRRSSQYVTYVMRSIKEKRDVGRGRGKVVVDTRPRRRRE
jgi:hypothetical protein